MKTSVVLFDAGGVLFYKNVAVGDALQEKFGLNDEDQAAFWEGEYLKASRGEVGIEQLLDWFAEHYDLPRAEVTEAVFTEPFERALRPIEGMHELVKKVAETGVQTALLTDTSALFTKGREAVEAYRLFEKRFISCETGFLKPDPRAYQNVINHYGLPPAELFFIDDSPKNIEAAKSQGMRGVVFENAKQLESVLRVEQIL